ncbi:MAG: hypothetical protein EAZ92_12715 [Candidatus Kapaibacterium sp.]|nr:MAG: hypothetical protein EAZ92_12715 [Candidatus Kapabacteria bacterium]
MSYNKFKIRTLKEQLGIHIQRNYWLPKELPTFAEDTHLASSLQEAAKIYLGSEKARSEFVVTPVLQALYRKNQAKYSIFSGYEFTIDKNKGLNGFCDFIFASASDTFIVEAPAFFIVETKKTDIDDNAIAQCSAELYAAQLFNAQKGKPTNTVFGCVTSAYSWGFLKLEQNIISIDPDYVSLSFSNPYHVLAALQWIVDAV